jgi:hypothetical protein
MSYQINYTDNSDTNNISTYDGSEAITQIVYNNQLIPTPTPLVSIERENLYYNQYWGNSDKIVLNGYNYGNGCSPFDKIIDGQKDILGIFDENFGNFQIFERGPILSKTFTLQPPLYKSSKFAVDPVPKTLSNGLYGKRYVGYFTDFPTWFITGTLQGEVNQLTSINNFSNNADSYSWQWLGYFKPSTTETYTFYTESSDSSLVWVGNSAINSPFENLVVNNSGIHGLKEESGLVNLDAGIYYPIKILFGEEFGQDSVTVSFSTPTIPKTTNGLGYYYYNSGSSDYIEDFYENHFGYSTSIDSNGHTVIIGAPHDTYGDVYISYKTENGWSSLISLTGTGYYHRGSLVKINNSGNLAVVAKDLTDAYPFSTGVFCFYTGYKDDWRLVSTVNSEKSTGIFSTSMDINASGNILLVGSKLDDDRGFNTTGSVYIFTGNNYNLKLCQRINGESISGNFGCAVALNDNGNIGIIGAMSNNINTGSAWVITGNGIRWEKAFQLSGRNTGETLFGNSVAINSSGNIIFVGHEFDQDQRGAVHIFTGSGNFWVEAAKISGDAEGDRFGSAIDLNSSGNIAIISSSADSPYGSISIITGQGNNWNKISKILANQEENENNQFFGYSISINSTGNRIIVGMPNIASLASGGAYLYEQNFAYEKIYENSGIIVRSINFNESNYAGLVDYTIELNSTRVSGSVIDPTNEFQFTENENKTISLSHSISAKGINTNLNPNKSNALNNAIFFVRANTGLANVPSMKFISGNMNKFYLQNFSESIDRLNAIYSVQETYTNNYLDDSLSGNLTYSVDINSGSESNFLEINIKGQYKGPKNGNINDLRSTLNVTGLVTGAYNGYYNPIPLQYNITENTGENSINFDYSFDNINLPNPYYKYDSNISRDELEQVYNIQVRGDIIARGNRNYRYFLSTGNIVNLTGQFISIASGILTGFKDFNSDSTICNLRLLSLSIDQNPNDGTISASASYDDKFMPTGDAVDASYNISVEAPRWYMNNQATCNIKGFHIINDFDITTLPKISANTSLKYKDITGINNENILRSQIKNITKNIIPTNYNFNTKLQDSESYTKKYNSINSITEISYNLDKIDLSNENGLLPKFNTI